MAEICNRKEYIPAVYLCVLDTFVKDRLEFIPPIVDRISIGRNHVFGTRHIDVGQMSEQLDDVVVLSQSRKSIFVNVRPASRWG